MFHEGVPIRKFRGHPCIQIEVDVREGGSASSVEEGREQLEAKGKGRKSL